MTRPHTQGTRGDTTVHIRLDRKGNESEMSAFANTLKKEKSKTIDVLNMSFYQANNCDKTNKEYQTCVIERHSESALSQFLNFRSLATFSIRFKEKGDTDAAMQGETRLWAKRRMWSLKSYYVVSANVDDLTASVEERSDLFLGTLRKKFEGRMFKGYAEDSDKDHTNMKCVVMYDHERSSTDDKMEVAVPKNGNEPYPQLLDDYTKIRQEGSANHGSTSKGLVIFREKVNDTTKTKNKESLANFDSLPPESRVSAKNFQLVRATATAKYESFYASKQKQKKQKKEKTATAGTVATTEETVTTSDDSAPPAVVEESGEGDDDAASYEDSDDGRAPEEVFMQLVKVTSDSFELRYKAPFTLLQAFMIALSRFETEQRY